MQGQYTFWGRDEGHPRGIVYNRISEIRTEEIRAEEIRTTVNGTTVGA